MMEESGMDKYRVVTQTTPTVDFETTTTLPSDVLPFNASTGSDSVKKEYTDSDSVITPRWIMEEWDSKTAERFLTEFLASWEFTIVGSSAHGISRDLQKKNSNDGSTGPSPEEVEP